MKTSIIAQDPLRASLLRRHMAALGHTVEECTLEQVVSSTTSDTDTALVVADLTDESDSPGTSLSALHRTYPQAESILLMPAGKTLTREEEKTNGVRAVLREPFRLDELELQLGLCLFFLLRRPSVARTS